MFTAKFKVSSIEDFGNNNIKANMTADTSDRTFTQYTPTGNINFVSSNPNVNEQIKPGDVFEVTFKKPAE